MGATKKRYKLRLYDIKKKISKIYVDVRHTEKKDGKENITYWTGLKVYKTMNNMEQS